MSPRVGELIAAHYTVSGAPANTPARVPPRERIAAISDAGYDGLGLHADDCDRWGRLDEIRRCADDHGIRVSELEFLVSWSLDGPPEQESRRMEDQLYRMAEVFGSDHINVGIREVTKAEMAPLPVVAERFGSLCDRAARYGLTVAFEFMPFRAIDTLDMAAELVRLAARPNGGILLDAWHWFRGTPDSVMIQRVEPDMIVVIQLCDGFARPVGDLLEDTQHHRLLPGEGAWDLVGLLRELDGHGVEASISVEILSAELRQKKPSEMAASSAAASRRVTKEAYGS
jgi:sugar phosphate isomerase/epimerase